MRKKLVVLAVLFLSVLIVTGCSVWSGQRDAVGRFFELSAPGSADKILEDYLPAADTTLFFALRPDADLASQFASWRDVSVKEAGGGQAGVVDWGLLDQYRRHWADFGLSYDRDIAPLWTEGGGRLAYGVTRSGEKESLYLALTVTEEAPYEKLIALLREKAGYQENDYKGQKIVFNEEDAFYSVKIGDLLVITDTMDNARLLINRSLGEMPEDGQNQAFVSLRSDTDYRRGLAQVKEDYWFWLYLDSAQILGDNVISANMGLPAYFFYGDESKVSKRVFYGVKRSSERIYLRGVALQKDGVFEPAMPFPLYLTAELPADKLIFALEKANLADLLMRARAGGLAQAVENFEQLIAAFGLDYKNDLEPILAKNMVLALYESGYPVPNGVFLADVGGSEAEDGARKIVDKLEANFAAYALAATEKNLLGEREKKLLQDTIKLEKVKLSDEAGELSRFSVDPVRFLTLTTGKEIVDEGVLPPRLEIYYGLLNERLWLAVYPQWESAYDQIKVGENTSDLDARGGMNFYLNGEALTAVLKKWREASWLGDFDLGVLPFKKIHWRGRDLWGLHNAEAVIEL